MKGASAELSVNSMNNPNSKSIINIGPNQYFLLFFMYPNNSKIAATLLIDSYIDFLLLINCV